MYRGQFKMWNVGRSYGFIYAPEFPQNIFCHTKNVHLPPGESPVEGDSCTFDVGHDSLGRACANNVRLIGGLAPKKAGPPKPSQSDGARRSENWKSKKGRKK
jgi:cold shock CspA family protein